MAGVRTESHHLQIHHFLVFILIPVLITYILNKFGRKYYFTWVKGFLISGLFFLTGFFLPSLYPSDAGIPEKIPEGFWICRVSEYPFPVKKSCRIKLKVKASAHSEKDSLTSCSILAYFSLDSLSVKLKPGDIILVRMSPERPQQNGNPKEFNYRRYLYRQGIYYQSFIRKDEWMLLESDAKSIRYLPLHLRQSFVNRLRTIIKSQESFGVISALSVGMRDFMEEETKLAYSDAGAMHVLAVSGLHVGLLWYMLNIFFGKLKQFRVTRYFYWILMTSLLWMYVLITGMSPSVTRAGIMLTLVITSGMVGRYSCSSNPVFLSAFILLVANPFLLFDLGFQFSYLAVSGILFFQPVLNNMFHFRTPFFNYLWSLTTVSVAAQSATFIPALYYFNKFPVYFILSNFLVIPLVTGILLIMVTSVFFWFADPVFLVLTKSGAFLSGLMNNGVRYIEALPLSSLKNLFIDEIDVLLLFLSLFMVGMAIQNKRNYYLVIVFFCLSFLIVYDGIRDDSRRKKGFIVVHNIRDVLAIDMAINDMHYFITSDLSEEKKATIIRNCGRFWLYERKGYPCFIDLKELQYDSKDLSFIPVDNTGVTIILFKDRQIALIEDYSCSEICTSSGKILVNMIIANTSGALKTPSFLSAQENADMVIASGFRGRVYMDLQNELNESSIWHKVNEEGAYVLYFRQGGLGGKYEKN